MSLRFNVIAAPFACLVMIALAQPLAAQSGRTSDSYAKAAAASDLFEIQSGQLALEKSQNDAVKSFAKMTVDDHTDSTSKLKNAMSEAGIAETEPELTAEQQKILDKLQPLSGRKFDREYVKAQADAHAKALALHKKYSTGGDTPALTAFAASVIPVIEHHKKEADVLAKSTWAARGKKRS